MPIFLYKPNKSNSGFAFQVNATSDYESVYFTLIRQSGWDAEKGNGTFKENVKSPENRINIKLNYVECAAVVDCVENGREWSTYHDGDAKPKTIKFSVWLDKTSNTQRGFSLFITAKDKTDSEYKNEFRFGFSIAEGRYLKEFLLYAMRKHFKNDALKNIKPVGEVMKKIEKVDKQFTLSSENLAESLVDL